MGIESFFTLQNGPGLQGSNLAKSGTPANDGTLQNLDFLGLILSRLGEDSDKSSSITKPAEEKAALTTKPLSIAEFLAANPDIEEQVRNFMEATDLGGDAELLQTLGLNQQAFDNTLIPTGDPSQMNITTLSPEKKDSLSLLQILQIRPHSDLNEISGQINALRAKIQKLIENGEQAVLTTNLTPQQITALQNSKDGEWPKELEGVDTILIALLQPQGESAEKIKTDLSDLNNDPALANVLILLTPPSQKQKTSNAVLQLGEVLPGAEETIASKLNALKPGIGGDEAALKAEDFEASLKTAQPSLKSAKGVDLVDGQTSKNTQKTEQTAGPGFSAVQGAAFGFDPALFGPAADSLGLYDDIAIASATSGHTQTAGMMSLITGSAGATAPHAATQLIAVSIQKNATNGQDKTFALDLDPPELGRMEIRLTFAKDKTIRAHVITEKPETYMMLQRDSDTLQRILEASGLESDGGLSFELAEQGFNFDGDNNRGGGHDQGGTGASDAEELERIQTTMTWHVDPETGHMRYNIFA
jgi:flagellar hook-length control protein FliK